MGKKVKKLSEAEKTKLKREQIIILLNKLDGHANECLLYGDQHFKWLMENVDENNDKMWGIFSVFIHHFTQLVQTNREFAKLITGEKEEIKPKEKKENEINI